MSTVGHALWKALDKPDDWKFDRYSITHKPSNQSFWIANGPFFFNGDTISGTLKCIGLIERHWLYWKAIGLRGRQVALRLEGEVQP